MVTGKDAHTENGIAAAYIIEWEKAAAFSHSIIDLSSNKSNGLDLYRLIEEQ